MFIDKKQIARSTFLDTARFRMKYKIPLDCPINALDFAESIGIEVRIQALSSLEALYFQSNSQPTFILSSLRPLGRINYNCLHELGHYYYKHGNSIDEYLENDSYKKKDSKEYQADYFASFLLMPDLAVKKALKLFSVSTPKNITPFIAYILSTYFGVGYATLINHLTYSLKILTEPMAKNLLKESPKNIKSNFLKEEFKEHLLIFEDKFMEYPIDLRTEDIIFLPKIYQKEGNSVILYKSNENGNFYKASKTGINRILNKKTGNSVFIRISDKNFEGRAKYRHLEDVNGN